MFKFEAMRKVCNFFALVLLISCGSKHYYRAAEQLDPMAEAQAFSDSLLQNGVDTLVTYLDACSGCLPGVENNYYIFWIEKGAWKLTKINQYSRYKIVSPLHFPIFFLANEAKAIMSDPIEKPYFQMLHYHYEVLKVHIGNTRYQFRIDEFEKNRNQNNYKVWAIDKLRADLFELQPGLWQALDYKYEKVKEESFPFKHNY